MFRRGWFRRNWIYSDEGFSVQVAGRFAVIYREGKRRMAVSVEMLTRGFAISLERIGRWDDDPIRSIGEREKHRIVLNIKRALESQGESVELLEQARWKRPDGTP
jgi:hypothetical protein